jgi:hypothetical protein
VNLKNLAVNFAVDVDALQFVPAVPNSTIRDHQVLRNFATHLQLLELSLCFLNFFRSCLLPCIAVRQ